MQKELTEQKLFFFGIDYLRAIFSIAVVFLHVQSDGYTNLFHSIILNQDGLVSIIELIYLYFFCLAVPSFIIISAFLFALKNPDLKYLFRRLRSLGTMYFLWSLTAYLWHNKSLSSILQEISKMTSFYEWLWFVVSAAKTPYYFFFSLGFVLVLVYLVSKLNNTWLLCFLSFSIFVLGVMPLLGVEFKLDRLCVFDNPLNFLPYAPMAVLLSRIIRNEYPNNLFWGMLISLILGSMLSIYLELNYYVVNSFWSDGIYAWEIPIYTRNSLLFMSTLILALVLKLNIKSSHPVISFMSQESLGLYCLHIFIIETAVSLSQKFIGRIDGTNICFASLVDVLVILAICYPLSRLWKEIQKAIRVNASKYPRKNLQSM